MIAVLLVDIVTPPQPPFRAEERCLFVLFKVLAVPVASPQSASAVIFAMEK